MMQQAGDHAHNLESMMSSQPNVDGSFFYEPTDQDRINRLIDSSKKGLCKGGNKKDLLFKVLQLKKELINIARDSNSDLEEKLSDVISNNLRSKNVIKNKSNTDLAAIIVSLFCVFEVLEERLKDQQRRTRNSSTRKPSPVIQLISQFTKLRQDVDNQIIEMIQQVGENDPILKGVVLTPYQKLLTFNT